ncbi:FAD-dependent thymidylate synthase [Methanonatronarchaeum sp. AMET-Sl]|uniref:FAD-dependent thymidylate synthase n=1 Tax=Methanonatronarchaeum sp. AMET-Sl TaxID=3037654 RepID=UPI00244DB326|nr:FAD-dependent thymidylate synthase [Methanonatronarchaeum sp. AMET-Sl]WGI17247.1 FAD-dependent thymidylate synthase [Methanonatronarchaeum sp. AMET-Sl]
MKVTILNYTDSGEELLTKCGMATTTETPPSQYKIKDKDVNEFMEISREMELSSVFNFPTIIYEVKDVSRSFTHQHVRHRMAAHMQQSLRYTEINPKDPSFMITPPSITKKGVDQTKEYIQNQLNAAQTYKNLLKKDIPPEDARFALPIGVKTFLTTAMNVESILHYLNVRACMDSQWEIRANAYTLLAACKLIYPKIFQKAGPHCITGRCKGRGKGKCKNQAKETIKKIENKINKTKPKFESLKTNESISIDLTEILGYEANPQTEKQIQKKLNIDNINLSFNVKLEIQKN